MIIETNQWPAVRLYGNLQASFDNANVSVIEYIKNKLEEGCFEETVPLLIDFVNAFHAIEKALQPVESLLLTKRLGTLTEILRQNLDLIVTTYEQRDLNKAYQVMGQKLLPSYKEWHAELDRVLLPVVVS